MTLENHSTKTASSSAFYRAVWRWHFWAGLLCAPIILVLAITGSIYLFKPQYEAWRYRELLNVAAPTNSTQLSPDAQLAAAQAAAPAGWRAASFTAGTSTGRTSQIVFQHGQGGGEHGGLSLFVNPYSGEVVGQRDENTTLMAVVKKIHGSLLIGSVGDFLVEMAASWCAVLLITGLYLWWPRPFSVRGFFLPRFGSGKRALLRDLHAVPAVWFSIGALFLIATGIPWASTGGKWFRTLAQAVGEWQPRETSTSAHRSELLGGWSPYMKDKATAKKLEAVASTIPKTDAPECVATPISLSQVMHITETLRVTDAYTIALPNGPTGVYSVFSDRNRAFTRAYIHIDQYSGKILADVRFKDFGLGAKFFSFGIIAHEGQLFGLANQLLGLAVCLGLIGSVITGVALWWQRRPAGTLAAPTSPAPFPKPLLVAICLLALFLPLLAASLVVLLIGDFLGANLASLS